MMDIAEWIRDEHKQFRALLGDVVRTTNTELDQRVHLFEKARRGLHAHATAEEEVLFIAMQENSQTRPAALEALEWHRSARRVMKELVDLDPKHELWLPKMKVVQGVILVHFEIEESDALRSIQKAFEPKRLDQLYTDFRSIEKSVLERRS